MTYIDSHCHIDMYAPKQGEGIKIKEIIEQARKEDVRIIINNGVNPETNRKTLSLSAKFPEVRASLGLYPIDAIKMSEDKIEEEIEFIRKNKSKIVSIGEIGLDFKENTEAKEKQKRIFIEMLDLAKELDMPVQIHSRKAELECIEILEKTEMKKVIMHCFCGKIFLVKRIIDNGWFLTIPTNVTFSEHFQQVIKETPITQILCETDSPFLHPHKERNNIPSFVIESYKKIAEIKGLSLDDVKKQIYTNFTKLFNS